MKQDSSKQQNSSQEPTNEADRKLNIPGSGKDTDTGAFGGQSREFGGFGESKMAKGSNQELERGKAGGDIVDDADTNIK